jgi:hypothetical protein
VLFGSRPGTSRPALPGAEGEEGEGDTLYPAGLADGAAAIMRNEQDEDDARHDHPRVIDAHEGNELLQAAVWYLDNGAEFDFGLTLPPWPWEQSTWKPSDDRVRQLVKAGALIAAEIDRLQRRDQKGPS